MKSRRMGARLVALASMFYHPKMLLFEILNKGIAFAYRLVRNRQVAAAESPTRLSARYSPCGIAGEHSSRLFTPPLGSAPPSPAKRRSMTPDRAGRRFSWSSASLWPPPGSAESRAKLSARTLFALFGLAVFLF